MSKSKVLAQINCSAATNNSTGNIVNTLAQYAKAHGWRVVIGYSQGNCCAEDSFCYAYDFERRLHGFLTKLTGLQGFFSYFSTKKLIRKLEYIQPQVVHLHNLHESNICLPVLCNYFKKNNINIVITLHDCWLFTGGCCHFAENGCTRWKVGCGKCKYRNTDFESLFDNSRLAYYLKRKSLMKLPSLVSVGVSHWVSSVAQESFLSCGEIVTIYNWVDRSIFFPDSNLVAEIGEKAHSKFVILGVSSVWSSRKHPETFKNLSSLLAHDEIIIMIGEGLDENALPDNIVAISKPQNSATLASYYRLADVLLNASFEETFGLVAIEAIACGTPCVCFDSTACGEVVKSNCGVVLDKDASINQLYNAIQTVRLKGKASYSKACCNRATYFEKNKSVQQYLSLYERLLAKQNFS